jgi:hypothetical protein
MTVRATLAVVEGVLASVVPSGFQTPSTAFVPDCVLGLAGVVREVKP